MLPDEQFASLAKKAVESARKDLEEKKKIQESQSNYLIDSEIEDEFANKKTKDVTEYYEDVNNMDLSQLIAAELETPLMSDDDDDDDMSVRKMLMYDETRRMPLQTNHPPNVKQFQQPNAKTIKSLNPPKSKKFKHSTNSTYIPKHKKNEEMSEKKQSKSRKQGFKKPKEKLQCLQSIFKERKIPERGVWVQCTRTGCNKWRYLNDVTEPSKIDELWSCDQNSDDAYNSCEKPEADWKSVEKQQGFVDTKFTVGTIVWAKLAGYPWWPAMVEEDPNVGEYFWLVDEWRSIPSDYHVVFLDKNVTRSWINRASIKIFSNPQQHLGVVKVKGKLLTQLQEAKQAAVRAKTLSITERIAEYGFSSHYTGKWGGADRLLFKEFQKKWPGHGKDAADDALQQGDDSDEMSDDSTEEDVDSASSVEQKSEMQAEKQRKRKHAQSNDLKIKKSRKENTNQENSTSTFHNPNYVDKTAKDKEKNDNPNVEKTGRNKEKNDIENCEGNEGKTNDHEEAEDASKNAKKEDEVTKRSDDTDDNEVIGTVDHDQNEMNDENQKETNNQKDMADEINKEIVDNCQNETILNDKSNEPVNEEIEGNDYNEKNNDIIKERNSKEMLNKDEVKVGTVSEDDTKSESKDIAKIVDETKSHVADGNTDIGAKENVKQKQKKKQRKIKNKSENFAHVEDSLNKVTGNDKTTLEETTKLDNEISDNGKFKENQENETNTESGKAKQKKKKPRKQKNGSEMMKPDKENKESNTDDDDDDDDNRNKGIVENIKANSENNEQENKKKKKKPRKLKEGSGIMKPVQQNKGSNKVDDDNDNKEIMENIKADAKNDDKEKKKKPRKQKAGSENTEQNPIKKDKLKRQKTSGTVTEEVKNHDKDAKEQMPTKRLGTKTNINNIEVKETKPTKLKPTFKAPKKKENKIANTANKPFKPPTVTDTSKNKDMETSTESDDSGEQVKLHVADESKLENEKKKLASVVVDHSNKGENVSSETSTQSDDSREQFKLHGADENKLENEKKELASVVADQNKGEIVSSESHQAVVDSLGILAAEKNEEPDSNKRQAKKNESISALLKDRSKTKDILKNNENQVVPSGDIDLIEQGTLDSIDAWDQSATADITKHDVDQADQDDSQPFEIEE